MDHENGSPYGSRLRTKNGTAALAVGATVAMGTAVAGAGTTVALGGASGSV